ncbi:protein MIZU-KUSSEI 1-like [Aristolochia californica]|uniref:protein MIZU-KUSSEI 1-like n=1 Tax=Aristolochia californica TaxID=171875 RepID=UPI0035D9F8EF
MKTIMARTPHDSSFSSSKRHLHLQWRRKKEEDEEPLAASISNIHASSIFEDMAEKEKDGTTAQAPELPRVTTKKKTAMVPAIKIRSVLAVLAGKTRWHVGSGLGNKMIGTLFGYRRGHVHFAFQEDPKSGPALLIELATSTCGLVKEMASGLVRIALECDKKTTEKKSSTGRLIEEPLWRTYCNGKKCGFAKRRECGPAEWKVLKAVEPISMGAGVLPGNGMDGSDGELMYMRARFERVVGSRDSEAFYMMNPDGSGGPELSIYLLRV